MQVEKTVLLPVSADEAFSLITEPDRLRRWQTVCARIDLRAGGEYRWTVVPGHTAAGTVTEVVPGQRIVLDWAWEAEADHPGTSTVTITVEPAEGGTLVRLVHEGLADEHVAGHLEGWNHFYERLERAAAHGDAGPDEWAYAPADLDQITSAEATLAVCQNVLRHMTADDLGNQTPCKEFTVAQLADHLTGSIVSLGGLADVSVEAKDSGTLESRIAYAAQQALEGWHKRGIEGTVKLGPDEIPAAVAASILSIEFLIHAWDFAAATGQKVTVSDEVTSYVLDLAEQIISTRQREDGSFAPAIEVGPDAGVLDRLLAFSGRVAV